MRCDSSRELERLEGCSEERWQPLDAAQPLQLRTPITHCELRDVFGRGAHSAVEFAGRIVGSWLEEAVVRAVNEAMAEKRRSVASVEHCQHLPPEWLQRSEPEIVFHRTGWDVLRTTDDQAGSSPVTFEMAKRSAARTAPSDKDEARAAIEGHHEGDVG